MRESIIKKIGIQMMGILAALCMTFSYNPIGFSYFAAVYLEKSQRLFIFPIVLITIALTMPFLSAIKYLLAMLVTTILVGLIESKKGVCGKYLGGLLAGASVMSIQIGGALMAPKPARGILVGILEGCLIFTLVAIFSTGIHSVLYKKRGEALSNDEMIALGLLFGTALYAVRGWGIFTISFAPLCMYFGILLAAYRYGIGLGAAAGAACGVVMTLWHGDISSLGVMCCIGILAGVFRSLGKLGTTISYIAEIWILGNFYAPFLLEQVNVGSVLCSALFFMLLPKQMSYQFEKIPAEREEDPSLEEKKGRLLEVAESFKTLSKSIGKFHEQNDLSFAAAVQLTETANILETMSDDLSVDRTKPRALKEAIRRSLLHNKIESRSIHIIRQHNGRNRIQITARTINGQVITVREACNIISKGYGRRVRPTSGCKTIVNKEFSTFNFIEEPNFMVLYGAAGITKEGEEMSGDNFSCTELAEGELLMGIVDGMGSGVKAYDESEQVIELLEDLLKTGYEEESALKLVNSVLLGKEDGETSTAIDIALTDLYSGKCRFYKSGAAATFIKRNQWVEVMKSTSLPVGVLKDVDYESACKKLYNGDYIIMVSDGVLEAFPGEDKETELSRMLMDITLKNPKEIAEVILKTAYEMADGKAADDMTVLVTGIWQKTA